MSNTTPRAIPPGVSTVGQYPRTQRLRRTNIFSQKLWGGGAFAHGRTKDEIS